MSPSTDTPIKVVILTRNRMALLQECIASVRPQLSGRDRILVVDSGSTDGTRTWLETQPDIEHRYADAGNVGFAEARNLAVSDQEETIAFIDDDCIAADGWAERIRSALKHHDAVGGLSLPGNAYRFPWWWSDELGWTVGWTGPDVREQRPGSYPLAANMAIRSDVLRAHPFSPAGHSFSGANKYLAGREDAEWWRAGRIEGLRLLVDPELVVYHRIPPERLRLSYVFSRARTDGITDYCRNGNPERVRLAVDSFADAMLSACTSAWRRQWKRMVQFAVWSARQFGYLQAARRKGERVILPVGIAVERQKKSRGVAFTVRVATAHRRNTFRLPANPDHVLITAPTFVGDSIVLQSAVYAFALRYPAATITVITNHPRLFPDSPANVRVLALADAGEDKARESMSRTETIAFVPYFHSGPAALWRRSLARRGITFNREVGFRRTTDYGLAVRIVEKPYGRDEILSLCDLLDQWNGSIRPQPPRLSPDSKIVTELMTRFPQLRERKYFTVQIGSGGAMKDWPLDRWKEFTREFAAQTGALPVFVGAEEWKSEAEAMARDLGALNFLGQSLEELIAVLSGAALAIGADSGPKHLAIALGTPTFTLYGPTDPMQWGALFDQHLHEFIQSPVPFLTPEEHAGLPPNHTMLKISAEAALTAALEHWNNAK